MSLDACAEIVARGDPDRFRAMMSAPVPARERMLPILAFNVEVARAPWVTAEPAIAEIRLGWWREALEEIGAGKPPRSHEVVAPLAEVVAQGVPTALLDAVAAAHRWDIYSEPFEDQDHFREYLGATGGGLTWALALSLGADRGLEAPVRKAGTAAALANLFLAVPELEARGRRPLVDGRDAAVADLARAALADLRSLRSTRFGAAVPALRLGWRAPGVLRRAARDPAAVREGRVGGPEFGQRASLMLRALRDGW